MKRASVTKAPYPRFRETGAISRAVNLDSVYHNFGSTSGTYVDVHYPRNGGYAGTLSNCFDVVTPGYALRSAQGNVFNNPFTSIKCVCTWGGAGPVVTYTGSTSPWPAGTTQVATHRTSRLHYDAEFDLGPPLSPDGHLILPSSIIDVNYLLRDAKTKALSRVDQSTAQGGVGIGELRKTLHDIMHPLQGMSGFIERFKFNKYNFRTKGVNGVSISKGQGLTQAVASQYLSFYYGMLPLMRDLESYLNAYIQEGLRRERVTARAKSEDTATSVRLALGNHSVQNSSQFDLKYTRTDIVSVCCGNLYEPTPATYLKTYGLRPMDFFSTAYELVPWSFFIDYFSNLGTLIEALTPRTGVTYLASWETYKYSMLWRAETTTSYIQGSFTHSSPGTEWAQRLIEATVRVPCSPFTNVGLALKAGNWGDKTKVLAVISLITQQFGKKFGILNF